MALDEPAKLDMAVHLPKDDGRLALVIFDTQPIDDAPPAQETRGLSQNGQFRGGGEFRSQDRGKSGRGADRVRLCTYAAHDGYPRAARSRGPINSRAGRGDEPGQLQGAVRAGGELKSHISNLSRSLSKP